MAYWELFSSGMAAAAAGSAYNSFQKKHEMKTAGLRLGESLLIGSGIDMLLSMPSIGIGRDSLLYVFLVGGGTWFFFNNETTRPIISEVDRRILSLNVNLGSVAADK